MDIYTKGPVSHYNYTRSAGCLVPYLHFCIDPLYLVYKYISCEDKTIAGVLRRAEATSTTPAPFFCKDCAIKAELTISDSKAVL